MKPRQTHGVIKKYVLTTGTGFSKECSGQTTSCQVPAVRVMDDESIDLQAVNAAGSSPVVRLNIPGSSHGKYY
jgi:hypothetical protein